MDETYIKFGAHGSTCIERSTSRNPQVDFYLSRKRDMEAAKQFLRKAMENQRVPTKITLDAYAASHRAVVELKKMANCPSACARGRAST